MTLTSYQISLIKEIARINRIKHRPSNKQSIRLAKLLAMTSNGKLEK
jgi:hypothetical protein